MATYDAFISYSHAKDKPLAGALQSAVQTLGKPWYKRRALRIFRDDTSLAASPHLWPSIEQALNQSRYLIVLASPEFAASRWCAKEVEFWLAHKGIERLLIAQADGDLVWDEDANDFAWTATTPLPAVLKGRFTNEPKWGDLRAFRANTNRRDSGFLGLAADFAAAIHGVPQEDLLSEELKQQRRALSLAWSAAGFMLVLGVLAAWQWKVAIDNEREARLQRDRAVASEQVAVEQRSEARAQRDRAERTLVAATETANALVVDLAREFRAREGVPIALVRKILERAQALQRQLMDSGEATPDLKYSEAMALYELVATYVAQGDTAAALQAVQRYCAIIEGLLAADPNKTLWQQVLGTGFTTLGDILMDVGRPAEAIDAFRKSVAIWEKLVAVEPSNTQWQWGLASGYHRLANNLDDQGRREEAFVAYQKSLAIWERLAAAEPDNPDFQFGLWTGLDRLGSLHSAAGRQDEALEAYRKALAICEKVVAADPTRGVWQRNLGFVHAAMADVLRKAGKLEEAIDSFRKSYAIRARLAASDLGNVDWQIDVINIELRLGEALREAGRREEATAIYRKAVAGAERVVAMAPEDGNRQTDLLVCLHRLGDVLRETDQRDEALVLYRRSLAIADRLAAREPDNALWQSNLAASLVKLAKAGDDAEARLRRALAIVRQLAAAGKLKPNQSDWIEEIERELAAIVKESPAPVSNPSPAGRGG